MNKINMATLVELHYGWCRQVFTRKKNLWNKKMNLWVQQYYRSAMLNWWSSLLKFFSHTKLHFRIKMNLAKEDKHLNLASLSSILWALWLFPGDSCGHCAGPAAGRQETWDTERRRRGPRRESAWMWCMHTWDSSIVSMSARQTTAFCFELGRNQTMSAQRKELPTTLESFSGL